MLPSGGAQELELDDPQGDVDFPVPAAMTSYDIMVLTVKAPENGTRLWGVGFYPGSFNPGTAVTDWVVRLHIEPPGAAQQTFEHELECLSFPAACAGGYMDVELCNARLWAEVVWQQPGGAEHQMDRVPDFGWWQHPCPVQDYDGVARGQDGVTDDDDGAASDEDTPADVVTPFPLGALLAGLLIACRRET